MVLRRDSALQMKVNNSQSVIKPRNMTSEKRNRDADLYMAVFEINKIVFVLFYSDFKILLHRTDHS